MLDLEKRKGRKGSLCGVKEELDLISNMSSVRPTKPKHRNLRETNFKSR